VEAERRVEREREFLLQELRHLRRQWQPSGDFQEEADRPADWLARW
jgi:uncharacterized protein YllA (UPF0747 family)